MHNHPYFASIGAFFITWEIGKLINLNYIIYLSRILVKERPDQPPSKEFQKHYFKITQFATVEMFFTIWLIYGAFTPFFKLSILIFFLGIIHAFVRKKFIDTDKIVKPAAFVDGIIVIPLIFWGTIWNLISPLQN